MKPPTAAYIDAMTPLCGAPLAQTAPVKPAPAKPRVICLCGSSRFCELIAVYAWMFEKEGNIALSLHLLPVWYAKATGKTTPNHFAEQEGVASQLDELHLRKIDMADEIFVVNPPVYAHPDGYIGERTRAEIEYAKSLGKPINYLTTCQTTRWPLPNLPSKE